MNAEGASFREQILRRIQKALPPAKPYDESVRHALRRDVLSPQEKPALRNALAMKGL